MRSLSSQRVAALLFFACAAVSGDEEGRRVGVLVQGPTTKGLFRDGECVVWALSSPPVRLRGSLPKDVSVFYTSSYAALDAIAKASSRCIEDHKGKKCAEAESFASGGTEMEKARIVPRGTSLNDWLREIDVLISFETALVSVFRTAQTLGVTTSVLVLNADWTDPAQLLSLVSAVPSLQLWTKGSATYALISDLLASHAMATSQSRVLLVPWSIPDPIVRAKAPTPPSDPVRFLFIAGFGGIRNRRGGDVVLAGWEQAMAQLAAEGAGRGAELSYVSVRHPAHYDSPVPAHHLRLHNLSLHIGPRPREALRHALHGADCVLYPSRWEGFGLSLLEALHAGVAAVGTDGWPINELIEHEHNGLLLPATQHGSFHLGPAWEVSPSAVASAVVRLVREPWVLARLQAAAPGELAGRRHQFRLRVRAAVLEEPPAVVLSLYAGPHPRYRRAELLRSDALRRLGYEASPAQMWRCLQRVLTVREQVLDVPYEQEWAGRVGPGGVDFALVAKAPSAEWLRRFRAAAPCPVFLWFWDPVDYGAERRAWFESLLGLVDLAVLNEKGREGMWADLGGAGVHYIEEGVMVEGDRGPGRRPIRLPPAATGDHVSFQGTVYPFPPDLPRVRVLLELAARGVGLAVYGPAGMWAELNLTSRGESYGPASASIHRQSRALLSLSRLQPDVELYRSERLMDGAAAGGCVLSETFPGLELLLPPDAVRTAESPGEFASLAAEAVRDPGGCTEQRERAETAAWRHHTWDDSTGKLLALLFATGRRHARLPRPSAKDPRPPGCVRDVGGGCCSAEGSYNLKMAEELMGWGPDTPPVDVQVVEGGIYFWAALSDCPSLIAAWDGLATALLAQGDWARAERAWRVGRRLKGRQGAVGEEGGGRAEESAAALVVSEWCVASGLGPHCGDCVTSRSSSTAPELSSATGRGQCRWVHSLARREIRKRS